MDKIFQIDSIKAKIARMRECVANYSALSTLSAEVCEVVQCNKMTFYPNLALPSNELIKEDMLRRMNYKLNQLNEELNILQSTDNQ
jgi:hypothetical protein